MNKTKENIIKEAYEIVKRKEYLTNNEESFILNCVTHPYGITLDGLKKLKRQEKEEELKRRILSGETKYKDYTSYEDFVKDYGGTNKMELHKEALNDLKNGWIDGFSILVEGD